MPSAESERVPGRIFEGARRRRYPEGDDRRAGYFGGLAGPPKQFRITLTTLVVLDGLLLLASVIHFFAKRAAGPGDPIFVNSVWNGGSDASYIEMLGHIQLVAAVVMLFFLWSGNRVTVYLAWALVFSVLVADDLLRLHERGGVALVGSIGLPSIAGLRAQDLGELVIWAMIAAPLGVLLVMAHFRARRTDRSNSSILFLSVVLLAVFAVVLDMIDSAVGDFVPGAVKSLLTFTETAGELGVMSLMLLLVQRMTLDLPVSLPRSLSRSANR